MKILFKGISYNEKTGIFTNSDNVLLEVTGLVEYEKYAVYGKG